MATRKPKPCKACGLTAPLNRKGHCQPCADLRGRNASAQMRHKRGPFYRKWRSAMKAYLERTEA